MQNTDLSQSIDMHAHFYGGGLEELLEARSAWPFLGNSKDGTRQMHAMNGAFPFKPEYFDLDVGLRQMDSQRIHRRMLTFPGALGLDIQVGSEVTAAIRAFNTYLASLQNATKVLSDEFEPVSGRTVRLTIMPHRAGAIQSERRCG